MAVVITHAFLDLEGKQSLPAQSAPGINEIIYEGTNHYPAEITSFGYGALVDNTPIVIQPAEAKVNHGKVHTFVDDYYNRIHINPSVLGLGNLLASQERDVEVWNAYFTPQLLSSITETNTESLTLVGSEAPPTTFAALEARDYNLSIAIDGPPVINALFEFNFPSETVRLAATGRRVVVWPFIPQTEHKETLEWKTDILKAFNREQRLALRPAPRQSFEYTFQLDPRQLTKAQGTATSWAYRVYGIGVWSEMDFIGQLDSGATSVLLDTDYRDYREGGLLLLWESDQLFEAISVATVSSTGITLDLPTAFDYTNAYVMPLRLGRTLQGATFQRRTDDYSIARMTFLGTDPEDLAPASPLFDQYRDKDVLTDRQVTVTSITDRIARRVDIFDNGSGPIEVDIMDDWVTHNSIITFDKDTREDRWEVRQWLHSLRGRQKGFWLPTWNNDLTLVFDVNDLSTAITCVPIGFSLFYSSKDIMFQLKDGTRAYNRILSVTIDGDGNEVFGLENAVGIDLNRDEIDLICFINHMRLNTDRIDINHSYGGRMYLGAAVTTTPEGDD